MTTAQGCRDRQRPPPLTIGEMRHHGVYLRNLKASHVSKRYERDNDDEPTYGYRLKGDFWKEIRNEASISVNEFECVGTECCSIAIHRTSGNFRHVASIDLAQLNHRFSLKFVAQYDPVLPSETNALEQGDQAEAEATSPEFPNPCHFLLLPLDSTTSSFFALRTTLDAEFPEGRLPAENEREHTLSLVENYAAAIRIVRNVWPPPSQPHSSNAIGNLGEDSSDQPIQQ